LKEWEREEKGEKVKEVEKFDIQPLRVGVG
jgi:hypothetical protein